MSYEPPLDVIKSVAEYLGKPLPEGKKELIAHLRGLESTRFKLAEAKVDWAQLLHEKKNQMLHPKDPMFTELDRKVMLYASTAIIERDYDFLCSIETLTEQRLEFGKLLLTIS